VSDHFRPSSVKTDFIVEALLSVYDKTDLLDLAKGLQAAGVRLIGSGGTAKKIRSEGIPIEWVCWPIR